MLLVAVLTVGCKAAGPALNGGGAVNGDAAYEAPPRRMVDDTDAIVGGGPDSVTPVATTPPTDGAAASQKDAPSPDVRSVDVAQPDAGNGSCSLLKQDCPGRAGCYRVAGGRTECAPSTLAGQAGGSCTKDSDCAPGLLCPNFLCQGVCSTETPACGGRLMCRTLSGYTPAGVCDL